MRKKDINMKKNVILKNSMNTVMIMSPKLYVLPMITSCESYFFNELHEF